MKLFGKHSQSGLDSRLTGNIFYDKNFLCGVWSVYNKPLIRTCITRHWSHLWIHLWSPITLISNWSDPLPIIGCNSTLCCTSLDGLRRTSPTPPPLLRPWLSTVTIHMIRESHTRSFSSMTIADGWVARVAMMGQQHVNMRKCGCCDVSHTCNWIPLTIWIFSVEVNWENVFTTKLMAI